MLQKTVRQGEMSEFGFPLFIVSEVVVSTSLTRLDERVQEEGKINVSLISFDMPQITYVFM